MALHPLRIAVIGGGLGGLSAALSLIGAGHDVNVYEQARGIGELGARSQFSPNASPSYTTPSYARSFSALKLRHSQVQLSSTGRIPSKRSVTAV